jgi:hypothetical protein
MTELQSILTETPEGRTALYYRRNGWQMPSDGPEMGAMNLALAQIYSQANEPGEILAALAQGRPVSSRMVHNARRYTPGYEEAYQALLGMLSKLPPEAASILDKDLRRLVYRAHAPLEKQVVTDQQGLVRLRRADQEAPWFVRDQWWLEVSRQSVLALTGHDIGDDWASSPIHLATGHLSARPLTMQAAVWPTADGAMVISVLVTATRRDRNRGLWAAEVILRQGRDPVFSPWRDLPDHYGVTNYPLLPQQGTMVRLGDVVLEGVFVGATRLAEFKPLDGADVPGFAWNIETPEGQWGTLPGWDDDRVVYFRPETWPKDGLIFRHPDHYAVRVIQGEDPETQYPHNLVWVSQVPGVTQYRPRNSRQD